MMMVDGTLREVIRRHEDSVQQWQMKHLLYIGSQKQPITARETGTMISQGDESAMRGP